MSNNQFVARSGTGSRSGAADDSSSCCERNWSTYAFIHSLKRNRLRIWCLFTTSCVFFQGSPKIMKMGQAECGTLVEMVLITFMVLALEGVDLALDEP
jgi:hypothetical protein